MTPFYRVVLISSALGIAFLGGGAAGSWQEAKFGKRTTIYDCAIVIPDTGTSIVIHDVTFNNKDGGICIVPMEDYTIKFHSKEPVVP